MDLKKLQSIAAMSCLLASFTAHADWLGTLKDAADMVKSTGVISPSGESKAPANKPNTSATVKSNSNVGFPLGLQAYPDAELKTRYDNPFAQVDIPISPPRRTSIDNTVEYKVPVEGKITML